jgi:hypothetical protein
MNNNDSETPKQTAFSELDNTEIDPHERIIQRMRAHIDYIDELKHQNAPIREQVGALVALKELLFEYGTTFYPAISSGRNRILAYMRDNLGRVVDSNELSVVSGIQEHARRIRELRREEGWVIASKLLGRPDIAPNQYVLETLERTDATERTIPEEVAKAVFERDNNHCVVCHWSPEASTPDDPRYLELHHRTPVLNRGQPTVENLEVRCNKCHKRAHTT